MLALVAAASANDIKDRLAEFRRNDNVDRAQVKSYLYNRHERRMEKLEELLQDRKKELEDHQSGRRLMTDEKHAKTARQAENFERKLTKMKSITEQEKTEMFEQEVDGFYAMNSVDYLDFDIPGIDK